MDDDDSNNNKLYFNVIEALTIAINYNVTPSISLPLVVIS